MNPCYWVWVCNYGVGPGFMEGVRFRVDEFSNEDGEIRDTTLVDIHLPYEDLKTLHEDLHKLWTPAKHRYHPRPVMDCFKELIGLIWRAALRWAR